MSKITNSAKGEECQMRVPRVCNRNPETVVWAHANGYAAGKPLGRKSDDRLGAYCCSDCHDLYDRRGKNWRTFNRHYVEAAFAAAHYRSFLILKEKGLV